MYRVNIYLESDSRYMGSRERKTGYFMSCILDNGQEYSDMKVISAEGTWNHCTLEAMRAALERMKKPSEIHIYSENEYILDMLEKSLPAWAENGFVNSRGKPVKDGKEWKAVWETAGPHLIVAERGTHEYSTWMKWEMDHEEGKTVDNTVNNSNTA